MDDYSADQDWENDIGIEEAEDLWQDEDSVVLQKTPEAVWSEHPIHETPPLPPQHVEDLADQIEIRRLLEMGVLVPQEDFDGKPTGKLTTKFVRDWRLKPFGEGDQKKWMRRSRLVAREYAWGNKRTDTFSPATGSRIFNLLPVYYFWMKRVSKEAGDHEDYLPVLSSLDVKDAFLQVPQTDPIEVQLQKKGFIIRKNLPGQRLGAKQWYEHLRAFLTERLGFTWCIEQPCLARNQHCSIVVHVDDILFCGKRKYWEETFNVEMAKEFTVSTSELKGEGSKISFLRRTIQETSEGWLLIPGTTVQKVVESNEQCFGSARKQLVPCDGSMQYTA